MEELITEKLSRLREYLGYLEEMKDIPLEAFLSDFMRRGAAERYLQLAIESFHLPVFLATIGANASMSLFRARGSSHLLVRT